MEDALKAARAETQLVTLESRSKDEKLVDLESKWVLTCLAQFCKGLGWVEYLVLTQGVQE